MKKGYKMDNKYIEAGVNHLYGRIEKITSDQNLTKEQKKVKLIEETEYQLKKMNIFNGR